jgi:pimeloyl-ACP methyl ester carboxylesterase
VAAEPVVLLHPFGVTAQVWRPVLPRLAERHEVLAPTLPGHGGGPPFEGEFTFQRLADGVERQLDDLGVGTAHLVGSSAGGALAIELAKRGRALSVVALSPGGGWAPDGSVPRLLARSFAWLPTILAAADPRLERILARPRARRLALRGLMRRGDLLSRDDAATLIRSLLACTTVAGAVRELRAGRMHLEELDRVAAPVLLAWGERDALLPARTCAARLREEIPGAEYRVLPGVGHVPMWDDPDLVGETIAGWVSRHARVPIGA